MSWMGLLKREIESTYKSTEKLFDLVDEDSLNWKPATGTNWMTVGQLLKHLSDACGAPMRGFVTGDWRLPEGVDMSTISPEEMLPPALKMPTVENVAEAKKLLAEDRQLAFETLNKCTVEDLTTKTVVAPWDPREMTLGHRLLHMVQHLAIHKAQLFCYLKLQGKPVNTSHLWGM